MKRIVVESPYAGDVVANEKFARAVCSYAVHLGHSPYASHLFFTQFLNDLHPKDREAGIQAGFAWGRCADEVWFSLEQGRHESFSSGMVKGLAAYKEAGLKCSVLWFQWKGQYVYPVSTEAL